MPIIIEKRLNEGIATTEYFIQKVGLSTSTPTFILDVGGGSTEISFVHQGNIKFNDSVKFAGNNIVISSRYLYENVVGSELLNYKDENEKIQKFNLMFSSDDFLVPGWNDKLAKFYDNELFRSEVHFLNSIFFGSLMFYLGMHLSMISDEIDIIQVALAGNGTRFLEIITHGNKLDEEILGDKWKKFFLGMLRGGYSIRKLDRNNLPSKLLLKFSQEPKHEVVLGLLYSKNLVKDTDSEVKKLLGLDIKFRGEHIKFYEWPDKNIKAVDLREAEFDLNIFYTFVKLYWESTKFLSEFIKLIDIQRDKVEENVKISLEQRGDVPIASPLFFECVFAYMKEYTKNLK